MTRVYVFIFATFPVLAAWSAEIPTDDMLLWLRADRVGTLDESNGVERWENHAPGTPRHAMQSEPERRPRWVSSVEPLGGRAVLVFDGKDDFLHVPWLNIGTHATVFMVAENVAQTAGGSHWRTILGGDDDSFREGTTKYGFGFRRADQEPRFIANLYYAANRSHRLVDRDGRRRDIENRSGRWTKSAGIMGDRSGRASRRPRTSHHIHRRWRPQSDSCPRRWHPLRRGRRCPPRLGPILQASG